MNYVKRQFTLNLYFKHKILLFFEKKNQKKGNREQPEKRRK